MIVLGLVNSVLISAILIFINSAVTGEPIPFFPEYDWLIFIALLVTSLLITRKFQIYTIRLNNKILFDFELRILQKFRMTSFESFRKFGSPRIYTAINDTKILANLPEVLIGVFNSLVMIICGITYMFVVSFKGGIIVFALMIALFVFYIIRNNRIEIELNKLRDLQDSYQGYLIDLINGFKEIKMSFAKNNNIYNKYIKKNRLIGKDLSIDTSISYLSNELAGNYSWYVVLGFIIFVFPRISDVGIGETSVFIITILYLMGPIAMIVSLIPAFTNISVASGRLSNFEQIIGADFELEEQNIEIEAIKNGFESLSVKEISYEYLNRNNETSFVFGPINLEISRGELIFVTGGNGSGKSTFVNLIVGLSRPTSGNIYLNGQKISNKNYSAYSNEISAIFSDHYLFNENYDDFDLLEMNEKLESYIDMMELKGILDVGNNKISNKLSKGQQKRLAMIYAMMENRDILVLDEWAADQDPKFREYFYCNLLNYLRSLGKTIIAVTHDDKYYSYADRIIRFDYGKITYDKNLSDHNS